MSFATSEDFLNAPRRFKETRLWNGKKVLIRSLYESEYSQIDVENIDANKGGLSRDGMRLSNCRLVLATVCCADKESPLFQQPLLKATELKALFQADTIVIEPLVKDIREHCGLRQDTEELLKNFGGVNADGSPSSSSEQPEPALGTT